MSYKIIAGLFLGTTILAVAGVQAQNLTDINAIPGSSYEQDNQGKVTRSQYGLCWRTGYWTPSDSISGCDGELTPPITNPTAPALVSNPASISTALATPVDVRACDFTVTLGESETFTFGKTNLSKTAQQALSEKIVDKLASCGQIDVISVTGHADRLGNQKQNREISIKRAEAVAAFLRSKKIAAPIQTTGAANSEPISQCPDNLPTKKLTSCLSPDRRVVIHVQGHEK